MHRPLLTLSCERLGLRVPFAQALALSEKYGFDAIDPAPQHLASLSAEERRALRHVTWGADRLEVDFRGDETRYRTTLYGLERHADALTEVGCFRVGTYLPWASETLDYPANLEQTATRLREIADVLRARDIRLGLEYIAPEPLRQRARYAFVHDLRGALEVVRAIDRPNVGVLLDSWHWHIAGETPETLVSLLGSTSIVAVDLNDAPVELPRALLVEQRELPGATGCIDLAGFTRALGELNVRAPIRVEAYGRHLRAGGAEQTVARAAEAMRRVLCTEA